MNPLGFPKCARRVLLGLAAVAGIFLTAGCGSGNSIVHPLGGGFSKASLKGQFVMRQTGTAINSSVSSADPFSEVTVFTADGNGTLNILEDDFDQDGGQASGSASGTYDVRSDGTGFLSFAGFNYNITLIDDSHFYLIEADGNGTSSGYGQVQDTAAFSAAPSGAFVFKAHNVALSSSSRVGGITITAGAISGTEDFLSLGSLASSQPVATSVAMSVPDATIGRGTFTLTDGTSFGYYVVNSSEFYFMSNTTSLEIGQAEAQTGTFSSATLANGNSYVFGSSGDTNVTGPAGIHSAGVFTTDGNGNVTAGGAVDYVQDLTLNSNLAVSGGTYTLTSNGRGTVDLTLSGGSISPQIFWMVNGTRAYFLANNTTAVEDGTFSQQTGGPFTTIGGQAALVMDGLDTTLKDRVGDLEPTSSGFNWNQTANAFDPISGTGVVTTTGTTGTYTVSSNGRVAAVVNGVTTSVVFYLSGPSSGFMVQEDANIGGEFTQQASQ